MKTLGLSATTTVNGCVLRVAYDPELEVIDNRNGVVLYIVRNTENSLLVWFEDDLWHDVDRNINSLASITKYVKNNKCMHIQFEIVARPKFGNWGLVAYVLDRINRTENRRSFYNYREDLHHRAIEAFGKWFGPSAVAIIPVMDGWEDIEDDMFDDIF